MIILIWIDKTVAKDFGQVIGARNWHHKQTKKRVACIELRNTLFDLHLRINVKWNELTGAKIFDKSFFFLSSRQFSQDWSILDGVGSIVIDCNRNGMARIKWWRLEMFGVLIVDGKDNHRDHLIQMIYRKFILHRSESDFRGNNVDKHLLCSTWSAFVKSPKIPNRPDWI